MGKIPDGWHGPTNGESTMKVVTLLDETLRFISLQTKKCHVQHTTRMARFAEQTLCGMSIPSDAAVRTKRTIATDAICGRCTRVLQAYYTELPGQPGKGKRAWIGESEYTILEAAANNSDNLMDLLQEAIETMDEAQASRLLDKVHQIQSENLRDIREWKEK